MRRIAVLAAAVLFAAGCRDQITDPGPGGPGGPSPSRTVAPAVADSVMAIPYVQSAPRVIGSTDTDDYYRYHNRPDAEIAGDIVAWRWSVDAYARGDIIYHTRLSTGTQTAIAQVRIPQALGAPRTSGRFTVWQDTIPQLLSYDATTGRRRTIPLTLPYALYAVSGDQLAYLESGSAGKYRLALMDLRSGATRTVATWNYYNTPTHPAQQFGFDGRYIAVPETRRDNSATGIVVYDTRTGQRREAVPFASRVSFSPPSVSAGRLAYARFDPYRATLVVQDIASGRQRVLQERTGLPESYVGQKVPYVSPRLSGNLVVWTDTREETTPGPFVSAYDVYAIDLVTGVEMPIAATSEWELDVRVDGNRVMWTQSRGWHWDLVVSELTPVSVPLLAREVAEMERSGAVHGAGESRALAAFLSNADGARKRGDRTGATAALRQFIARVRQDAGTAIDSAAARRLEGLAKGVILRV